MSNKEKETSKILVPPTAEDFKQYRYGDAVITCKSCGKDTTINHPMFINVEVAAQLPALTTDNRQFLGLACEHCDVALSLHMIPSVHPPAYDFNYSGFGTPEKVILTWTTGKEPVSFGVYLAELGDKEAKEVDLQLKGTVTEPSIELEFKKDTSYRLRVDTVYGQQVYPSEVIFISTEAQPEVKEDAAPTIELEKGK